MAIHSGMAVGQADLIEALLSGRSVGPGNRGAVIADDFDAPKGYLGFTDWRKPSPDAFRIGLLFNELLDLPRFEIFQSSALENPFGLEDIDIVSQSLIITMGIYNYRHVVAMALAALAAHDAEEPGSWSLWHETGYDPIPVGLAQPRLAARIQLQQALLVPGREVPFEDVVEFRERNKKSLRKLREHLDRLAIKIAGAGPDPAMARLEYETFEAALQDYLEEAKKPNWKKAIADLEISIKWADGIKAAVAAAGATTLIGLDAATASLATIAPGIAAAIGISSKRSFSRARDNSPFEYIVAINREFS